MSTKQYSKYLPIWNQLKETGECKVTAPPQFHKKIIKAVQKRRDRDPAFLYQLAEANRLHKIQARVSGTVITFTLTTYISIHGL